MHRMEMAAGAVDSTKDPLAWLEARGIALLSAKGPVPNLAEAIAGEPIQGSWWGHPKSHAIFAIVETVTDSPDVLVCKLIDGKVTLVHHRVWPALVALAAEIGPDRLARVDQEHTPSGKHVNHVTPFPDWVPTDVLAEGRGLSREEARQVLGPLADAVASSGRRKVSHSRPRVP
jgi:hypothetical protein